MKIENSIPSIPNASANDGKKGAETSSTSSVGQENNMAQTSLKTSDLQSVNSVESSSVADMARVQEIKQAISEGNFKVNSDVVADRLLETVKELIQSKEGNN